MCQVTCVKPKIELSDISCITINWMRISCSCLQRIFFSMMFLSLLGDNW